MKLARFNPFRGLPNPREVWAWGMFDLANQSFTLLINTLLFALFFKEVVVQDETRDDSLWALTVSISLLLVVISAPVIGAIADYRAWKKAGLIVTGTLCVILTCSLAVIPDGALWLAMALYIPANFLFATGENFLAAFLPEISEKRTIGRVSGLGFAMGYLGALCLLGIAAIMMVVFGLENEDQWRPLFVVAGLWFALMAVPTVLYLKERATPQHAPGTANLVSIGFSRLFDTVRHVRRYRQLMRFLCAVLVYALGTQIVIFFSSILAKDFGFTDVLLVLFLLEVTIFAGIGALIPMAFQDRLGHRTTVLIFLGVWTLSTAALAVLSYLHSNSTSPETFPKWPLWLVGNGLGLALGGLGTSGRALMGYMTPAHRTAEFFGLWGLVNKLAGVGVVLFGLTKDKLGNTTALVMLACLFVIGTGLMMRVNTLSGVRAARRAERAHAKELDKVIGSTPTAFPGGPTIAPIRPQTHADPDSTDSDDQPDQS